jgi:Na+/proline symporter
MMEHLLSMNQGALILAWYGFIMITLTMWVTHRRDKDTAEFLLAKREVGVVRGALSIAAAWIWAPALFVSSQKAFEQGIAGAFWFVFPNFLALLVFAPVALRIRKVLPLGYTFPQYIRKRHGAGVHRLYMIQFFVLQMCSFAVQILAGATLITTLTGIPYTVVALALVSIVLVYALLGGLRASVATDVVQMTLIYGAILLTIPWVIAVGGGWSTIAAGLGGVPGTYTHILDPWVIYSFGIATTIGLLAGPLGDQMHWQRAFALKSDNDVIKTFSLAAVAFAVVPLCLSFIGFLAAGGVRGKVLTIASAQMVGPLTVAHFLPIVAVILFVVLLLGGLCSTLDSILCAASALTVVDLLRSSHRIDETGNNTDPQILRRARYAMLVMALIGFAIAMIPGLKILHLFLFYATLRASTAIPTVLTLFWEKLESRAVFWAVLLAMIFGAPVMGYGNFIGNVHVSVAGSMLTVLIGLVVSVLGSVALRHQKTAL